MRTLNLHFELGELTEVHFQSSPTDRPRRSVRGKTSGPIREAGSFQWTSAVKALSLLVVKTVLNPQAALLSGDGGSLAASLDYAISKQPMWLNEMFGWDTKGVSLCRRMILRTNPERKRPGPVTLGMNQSYMGTASIAVFVDGREATRETLDRLYLQLQGSEPSVFEHASAA